MDYGIVAVFGFVALALYLIGGKVSEHVKISRDVAKLAEEARLQETIKLHESVDRFYAAAMSLETWGKQAPTYLSGLVKVCEDQVRAIDDFRASVNRLAGLIVGKQEEEGSFSSHDEDRADRMWRKAELMKGGVSDEDAEYLVGAEFEKKSVLPATE